MGYEQPGYRKELASCIGKKTAAQLLEFHLRYQSASSLTSKDGEGFGDAQPRQNLLKARNVEKGINLGRADFRVIMLNDGAGIPKVSWHLAFIPFGPDIVS